MLSAASPFLSASDSPETSDSSSSSLEAQARVAPPPSAPLVFSSPARPISGEADRHRQRQEAPRSAAQTLLPPRLFYFKSAAIYWSPWYTSPINTLGWQWKEHWYGPTSQVSCGVELNVEEQGGGRLLSFPLEFLTKIRSNYRYILDVVHLTFKEDGFLQWSDGSRPQPKDPIIQTGTLKFIPYGGNSAAASVVPRHGPHFEHPYGLIESYWHRELTQEANEQASTKMLVWKKQLESRDGPCFIWDEDNTDYADCQAVHILAPNWYDDYRENRSHLRRILNATGPTNDLSYDDWLYHPSSGLILSHDLHYCWTVGSIALWPEWNGDSYNYRVHVFEPAISAYRRDLHGKVIRREDLLCADDSLLPDPTMLLYHYQQCAMKMLRGYPYGPLPCDVPTLQESMECCNIQLLGGPRC